MIRYKFFREVRESYEGEVYVAYGIRVYKGFKCLLSVSDVFFDVSEAKKFCADCNRSGLDPMQIYEVIEDRLP